MTAVIQKWENSQGIKIPEFLLETLQWAENERLSVSVEKDKIIIERAEPRKSIRELFENFDGEYVPEEINWGKPEGKEIW